MERRLAAILVADAVGFSLLAGRGEESAIRTLKAHIGVMEPMISLHSGRLFKSTGDGFLAEFGSVVDAVSCAHALQLKMAERNIDQAEEIRMDFRIGVHSGDVVVDGDDILGDGVNLAARLEGVARPGGIAVSVQVHDEVAGKLDIAFEDNGLREFKNFAAPVQVFSVLIGDQIPEAAAVSVVDKPSVAVLPFTNMSAAADDDYFADGITEDIITALAYVPWIFVIARNSTFTYKGLSVDVRKIGRDLGVRYVLEGSVRRSGQRLRVTGQLIDAETGKHIWAERYDGVVEDVFDLQDKISESVVAAVAPEIRTAEIKRGMRKPTGNLDAYDLYLKGQNALHLGRLDEAHDFLAKAISTAPEFAKAMALKGWLGTAGHLYGLRSTFEMRDDCLGHAYRAMEQDGSDPEVTAYAGYTIGFYEANPKRGLEFVERATEQCPSFAWAWASSSMLSAFCGDAEQAIARSEVALRLSPRDPLAFRIYLARALAYMAEGNYEAVLENSEKGISLNPRSMNHQRYRIIALAELGRRDEAARELDRFMEVLPGFSASEYLVSVRDRVGVAEAIWKRTRHGMIKAGFPE